MVFWADDIAVISGANLGDGLSDPKSVCPGDTYALFDDALPLRLMVQTGSGGGRRVAAGSALGEPGDAITLLGRYTLMGDDGNRVELLVLHLGGSAEGIYALPLSPMGAGVEYTLLVVEDAPEEVQLSDLLCVSFALGTMITMGDGSQRAIETLASGDGVLTRDHGVQPVRWVGRATLRAVGAFAPVVITAGAMGNAGDLIVSQHHRMFLYLRNRAGRRLPTSEVLVQAKHLVNDDTVFLREGGFVDYLSLVFDRHEIIYAEGIPAESLMVTEAVVNRLPPELSGAVKTQFPGLSQLQHFGTEAGREAVDQIPLRQPGRR
ncbi:Hint domain-containing protein [Aliigemmobacter aestuarii]|uniref:Hint domain-containing protein n=2 Tax=Aliigemmobacter aestuarii TaxID=1445661 RepID=A0A4S3MN79_9RHOB|nr:Hint domain-containing protein [Gemmobacter aestuarii]